MNWIKSLFSTIWGGFKKVLPDKVKSAVVSYFSKNEKVLILLEPAMSIVKTVALSYGAFNVVAVVSAIQRTLSSWGIVSPPTPIQQVLAKGDAATVEEIKVALRELSKVLLSKTNKDFEQLSDSEKNLVVEMAYNMSKNEIETLKNTQQEVS